MANNYTNTDNCINTNTLDSNKISIVLDNKELLFIEEKAKLNNLSLVDYIRKKALTDDSQMLDSTKIIVDKAQVGTWYCKTMDVIKEMEHVENVKKLYARMEEYRWQFVV